MMALRQIFLLVCMACVFVKTSSQSTYPVQHGDQVYHCFLCPIGTMVSEDCREDLTNSTCLPCPAHQYMATTNSQKHCKRCNTSCPKNGRVHQKCTPTTNFLCLCEDGYHQYPLDPIDDHYDCREHTPCEAGYGVKTYGNHSHDTTCKECVEGQEFVDSSDPDIPLCKACSVCPPGSDVVANCSLFRDTECNDTTAVTTVRPEKNSDGLGGGGIAGIVIGIILIIIIIICVVIWLARKRLPCLNRIPCLRTKTSGQRDGENPSEEQRRLTHQSPNDEPPNAEPPNAEPPNAEPSNQETSISEPSDSRSAIPWSRSFIERNIFSYLSDQIGEKWKNFILCLPGWPTDTNVHTIIDHKIEEEEFVSRRILGCLREWAKKAEDGSVTKENIVRVLEELELNEVIAYLHNKAWEASSSTEQNGVTN